MNKTVSDFDGFHSNRTNKNVTHPKLRNNTRWSWHNIELGKNKEPKGVNVENSKQYESMHLLYFGQNCGIETLEFS